MTHDRDTIKYLGRQNKTKQDKTFWTKTTTAIELTLSQLKPDSLRFHLHQASPRTAGRRTAARRSETGAA